MMKFFSSWAEQIIIAVVITSIIEMILPDNKNKKYIKMVMGIYILFNIISPVINQKNLLSFDSFDLESYAVSSESTESTKSQEVNQSSMDERLQQLYVEELQNNVKAKVREYGYIAQSCKVDAILTGDEKNQGINKISLIVAKNSEPNNEKQDLASNSNIKAVNRVEVKVGLDKFFDTNDSDESDSNEELQSLKNELSSYYELDTSKIQISF